MEPGEFRKVSGRASSALTIAIIALILIIIGIIILVILFIDRGNAFDAVTGILRSFQAGGTTDGEVFNTAKYNTYLSNSGIVGIAPASGETTDLGYLATNAKVFHVKVGANVTNVTGRIIEIRNTSHLAQGNSPLTMFTSASPVNTYISVISDGTTTISDKVYIQPQGSAVLLCTARNTYRLLSNTTFPVVPLTST